MPHDIKYLGGYTLSSVPDGYDSFLVGQFALSSPRSIVYIVSDGNALARAAAVMEYMYPQLEILRFPAWDTVPYDRVSPNSAIMSERVETLSKLALNPQPKKPRVIVTSVGAVLQKLPP